VAASDKYLAGCVNDWMPQEINVQRDIELWTSSNGLTEDERHMVKRNPGFFVSARLASGQQYRAGTYRHITAPDCRQYRLRQAFEGGDPHRRVSISRRVAGPRREGNLQRLQRDPVDARQGPLPDPAHRSH